jgi:hypothetical protein
MEGELILHKAAESAGLLLRARVEANELRGYEVFLDPRRQALSLRRHGKEVVILGSAPCVLPPEQRLHVRIEASGPRWRIYWNREPRPLLEVTELPAERLAVPGQFGVRTWGADLTLDEVRVQAEGEAAEWVRPVVAPDSERALAAFCLLLLNLNEVIYID